MDASRYRAKDYLQSGRKVLIRAIRPTDKLYISDGFKRLSANSIRNRFFAAKQSLTDSELKYLTNVDFNNHVAIGALVEENERVKPIGVGRFVIDAPRSRAAEIAFAVEDAYQGLGVAKVLLKHLSVIACALGILEFRASVLSENRRMIGVFLSVGRHVRLKRSGSVTEVVCSPCEIDHS